MARKTDIDSTIDTSGLSQDKYDALTEDHILIQRQFSQFIERGTQQLGVPPSSHHSRTPQAAKNIYEVFGLIEKSIRRQEIEENKPLQHRVNFLYSKPDKATLFPAISASIERREPGAFGEGAPFEGKVKARKPMLREIVDNDEDPRYKKVILGTWFDNLISLTCWAKTNKEVNSLSLWLEKHMIAFSWFFRACGCSKMLYDGRGKEIQDNIDNNPVYGRPINYFVRTELISTLDQKKLTRVIISVIRDTFQ